MSNYTMNPAYDFRNESWALTGSSSLNAMWSSSSSDSNYASCPGNKGRAAVGFEQDISSSNVADGSTIESVTIYCRAARTDSTSRGITINMLTNDNTACFTGRTIPLTQTATTYEVGTYTHDAQNRPWTKDTLNQINLQCFTYDSGGSSDKVRCYRLYCQVNYRTRPVVVITAPSGTVTTAAPVVTFTYSQADGDIQKSAQYKIFTAAQVAVTGFNPDYTPSVYPTARQYVIKTGDTLWAIAGRFLGDPTLWPQIYAASHFRSGDPNLIYPGEVANIPGVAAVVGDVTSFTLPFALAAGDYFIYLRATSTRGATSLWASREFIVAGSSPGTPGGGPALGGIGTGGGGGFESVIADANTSNVFLTLRDGSNLLSTQAADFENLTDTIEWYGSNCTPDQDLTAAYGTGGASLGMTAALAADMTATSAWIEVDDQSDLTFSLQAQAAATGRTVAATIAFTDATFQTVGSPVSGSISDVTGSFTQLVVTDFQSPIGCAYAQVTIKVSSPASGETHNIDQIGLMYGVNSAWSNGGHASRNLLTAYQSTADDPSDDPAWTAATASTVTRVATTGVGSDGLKCFKMTYNGTGGAASISYVATATAYTDTTTSSTGTINKPTGVADGDVLVASIATDGERVASAPTGWSLVDQISTNSSSLAVYMRDALAADPSSWSVPFTGSRTRCRTTCVAYRGAAPTASQFARANINSSLSGSASPQTPTVNNTDPNAWRLSAFAVADNASGGSMTANVTPTGTAQPIAFVGVGGVDSAGSGTTFTINKPSNTAQGHMMFAALTIADLTGAVTAPSGWTILDQTVKSVGFGSIVLVTMYRFAGASEPASWSGSVTGSMATHITRSTSYSNVNSTTPWIAHGGQGSDAATFYTPSKNNTSSKSWYVTAFGDITDGGSSLSSSGAERADSTRGGDRAPNVAIYDSNGTISTGSHSATAVASNDLNLYSSAGWIGILNATTTSTTPGGNETERQDAVAGSSSPYIDLAVYDSNGTAATGNTTVYGTFTPGSGSGVTSSCAWIGYLVPGTVSSSASGEVEVTLSDYIELRNVSQEVFDRAGNSVTVQSAFLGSTAGTPHLKLYAFTANEQISEQVIECTSFNTGTWTKAIAQFVLPAGTTRLKAGLSAIDRNVNDYVLYDRVAVALGSQTVYRNGTGNTAHPIFDAPLVEFAEDLGAGYGDWTAFTPVGAAPLTYDNDTGLCQIIDQTMTPMSRRKYRARTKSYGLAGDSFISGYGPESDEVTLYASEWWLKDMVSPDLSMPIKVYEYSAGGGQGGTSVLTTVLSDTSVSFQPLGRDYPVVVTEGYKGETLTVSIMVHSADYLSLINVLKQGHTLLLQSNIDKAWWVRPFGNITADVQQTGKMLDDPLRYITVQFLEVGPDSEV